MADSNALVVGLSKAIYEAFKETHPDAYIDDFSEDYPVVIDGRFHLHAVAALLLVKYLHLSAQVPLRQAQKLQEKSSRCL